MWESCYLFLFPKLEDSNDTVGAGKYDLNHMGLLDRILKTESSMQDCVESPEASLDMLCHGTHIPFTS